MMNQPTHVEVAINETKKAANLADVRLAAKKLEKSLTSRAMQEKKRNQWAQGSLRRRGRTKLDDLEEEEETKEQQIEK